MASNPNLEWIVVQLTPYGEKEPPAAIQRAATKLLGRCEVYVPALETQIGEDKTIHYLMPGYAFVRKEKADRDYRKLENTRLFQALLRTGKGLATVASSHIDEFKEKLRAEVNQGIGEGDIVLICSGPYKNIEATVITEIAEERTVQVHVELRSKQSIITLPRSALKIVDRAPLSLYFARLGYLRSWFKMAKIVLGYRGDLESLQSAFQRYVFVSNTMTTGRLLFAFVHAYPRSGGGLPAMHADMLRRVDGLKRVDQWLNKGRELYNVVYFSGFEALHRGVLETFTRYRAVTQFEERVRALSESVEDVVRELARGSKEGEQTMQNVLIDGHNLAFRCAYAPGMARLADSKGRPTGMILGFLRSLGALRKRFPEACFWVAWDGSSKRRRARYPDYKGTRARRETAVNVGGEIFDPLSVIRETLTLLGVRQVWNGEEEADDVIATLVRGEIAGQENLICSTDRDFLQLVNASTMFLFPAVGSRKEVLYDVAGVEHQFGVPPEKVIQLRALFGDTSDNLPGVARVPKKVLKRLIQDHGSVEGLYTSGLAALNRGQYERLMEAAPQVKINLELMALVDVSLTRSDPDLDPEGAAEKLHDLDIKALPIVHAFMGRASVSN